MGLTSTAGAVHDVADLIDEAGRRLVVTDPGAWAFGAGAAGRFGELGRELHQHWRRALDARVDEASAHTQRVRQLAELVARTGAGLADAESSARDHQGEADGSPGVA